MTSNVDPINESRIQNAVTELAERRPAIVIAHRLKTVQNADPILVFQRNALVESGTRRLLQIAPGKSRSRAYSLPPCSSARTWQNHVTGNRAGRQFSVNPLEDALRVIPNAQIACGKRPPMPAEIFVWSEGRSVIFRFRIDIFLRQSDGRAIGPCRFLRAPMQATALRLPKGLRGSRYAARASGGFPD